MSYEMRIGLFAAITIAVTVWGYKFMKGKNLLKPSNTYYVEYYNVNQLTATSPVLIRGLRVGTVAEVQLSDDLQTVTAKLDINRGIRLARGTEALVASTSIMGGKAVVLKTPGPCDGETCHEPGDYLPGRVQGMIESMLGDSDIDEYVEKIKGSLSDMFGSVSDSLTNEETASNLAQSFRNIQLILANVEGITAQLNRNMGAYDNELKQSLANVEQFTSMLANNNEQISGTINNLNRLTEDLANAEIGAKADDIASSASEAVKSAEATMQKADETLAELKLLISNINEGEGTLGKLMTDEELFDNLNSTARNLDLLLQDFRLNPKRYVNVSVFGKKQKDYAVPDDDPAMQSDSTGNN